MTSRPGLEPRWAWPSLICLWLGACAGAPAGPARSLHGDQAAATAQLQALIRQEMRSADIAGLSIAVVEDQSVLWAHGEGWADRAGGQAAAPDTRYRMGSISKLLTATAAVRLAQERRLDLDAPVSAILPELAMRDRFAHGGPVGFSLRQLLSHHAGLPRDLPDGMWGRPGETHRELVGRLASVELAYPPGQVFHYSNLGPSLVGVAIERASGLPFDAYLRRSVLEPLGMVGARFSAAPDPHAPAARPYHGLQEGTEPVLRDVPAGGLEASVLDMSRFLSAVFDPRGGVLDPTWAAQMLSAQNEGVVFDFDLKVGLGWMLAAGDPGVPREAGPVIGHDGATVHYRSRLLALPRHRLGVIVASNSDTAGPSVDRIAEAALALFLEARTGLRPRAAVPSPVLAEGWGEAAWARWCGDYTTAAGHVRVIRSGHRLVARIADMEVELIPSREGFAIPRRRLFGIFTLPKDDFGGLRLERRAVSGRELLLAHQGDRTLLMGERLSPSIGETGPRPSPGLYRTIADEAQAVPRASVRITEARGLWLAETSDPEAPDEIVDVTVLRPVGPLRAERLGVLASGGEVVRWDPSGRALDFAGIPMERVE
ncbi:MAG: beta-lactamase family protein [Rhodocyclaceae bacterium]|nr:beta-lactamase family protein [Rhodocyclaceae bacterium]